ncbi:vacuolar-sorting snf7 protein [Rutstroemia sp. NJR-2017a BVV2]|nr:vacuolar-sorting snf7 protein [Rutstroemia sp. NJR-2017a BVV2]
MSGNAQKKKDSPKNAILALRAQLEMLQKREQHTQRQIDEQEAIARKNVSTNKNAAKTALRRKKQHEHTLEQTIAQISTLEQNIYSIEAANINKETLMAIEQAGKAMATIHSGLDLNKVDDTMYVRPLAFEFDDTDENREKIQEQTTLSKEIAIAITSQQVGEPIDETELEEELMELEQEALDNKMLKTGTVPVSDEIHRLPAAANGEIHAEEDDEEEELRKLQAEMAM